MAYYATALRPLRDRERRRCAFSWIPRLAEWLAEARATDPVDEYERAQELLELAIEEARRNPDEAERFKLVTAAAVLKLPPIECEVDGLLTVGGLSVIVGASNHGKSFLALNLALCSALRIPFHLEIAARGGPAVYVAAEGFAGQRQRLEAALSYLNRTEAPELYFLPAAPRIRKPADIAALLLSIDKLPRPPRLVFLDTERAMLDGSDSDDEAVTEFYVGAARIARETGAHVSTLHHTGWLAERERGSYARRCALDTLLMLTKEDGTVRVHQEKQRDLPYGPDLLFEVVPWGASAVLRPITEDDRKTCPAVIPPSRAKLLDVLKNADEGAGVSFTKWLETSGVPRSSFARAIDDLVSWGLIEKKGKKWAAV